MVEKRMNSDLSEQEHKRNNYRIFPKNLLEAALLYAKQGWKVFPLHTPTKGGCSCGNPDCTSVGKHPRTKNGYKDASRDEGVIGDWWRKHPNSNIGIATGEDSGIVVFDIDPQKGGDDSLHKLIKENGELPNTVEVVTGGGGRHLYFKHPKDGKQIRNKAGLGKEYPGLDIRGDGGYVVAPTSKHKSGNRYRFKELHDPNSSPVAPILPWLLELIDLKDENGMVFQLSDEIPQGQRNNTLAHIAGILHYEGIDRAGILEVLRTVNQTQCTPPLIEHEVERIARSISSYPQDKTFPLTDSGNAERFVSLFGEDIHYCSDWKEWMIWDGKRWVEDKICKIENQTKICVRMIYLECSKIEDSDLRKKVSKHANSSESVARRRAMGELAKSEANIPVIPEDFDTNPWLLNVDNGTLDLKSGKLLLHRREDLITKIAPVIYNKDAKCPQWDAFLTRIMNGNENLISFLKRAIGWALTGTVSEQVFFILYGVGANGKSTFLNTIAKMLGDYALHAATETLMAKNRYTIPTDLARLRGARFVTAIETEAGKKLAESLIKQVTGGDKVTARFLYGNFFEFFPEFKLFLATNHKPRIRGEDHAIWRRIALIPFTVVIPESEQDKELSSKLEEEYPGIMNWAMSGFLEWQKEGLAFPDEVKSATMEYRNELDSIHNFMEECIQKDLSSEIRAKDLFESYRSWCEDNGEYIRSPKMLGMKLNECGFSKVRKNNGTFWLGIRLQI